MQQFLKHLPHYISLASILAAGLIGFIVYSYDQKFQISVVLALALSYVSWGIIHHTIHRDISLSIILEYVAVSILGVVIVFSLIFRT